jgi:hypothetical protein
MTNSPASIAVDPSKATNLSVMLAGSYCRSIYAGLSLYLRYAVSTGSVIFTKSADQLQPRRTVNK